MTNVFKFRVANNMWNPNSAKVRSTAERAASQLGAHLSHYDDSDTSVAGYAGFFAKVVLNKEVNPAAFIEKFKSICGGEGLSYGTSADCSVCLASADWYNAGHLGIDTYTKLKSLGVI
jgi:hypothetical protein